MAILHPPNIFGYATGDLHGKTAHFISSSGSGTYADSTNSSTPTSLALAIAEDQSAGGFLNLIMDDGTYSLSADTILPDGANTNHNVWAGTTDIPEGGTPVNNGMPVIDFGAGAYEFFTGTNNWIENIKSQNNTGAGNGLFSPTNSGSNVHYKCWADNGVLGCGESNGSKFIFCRATNCSVGFTMTLGGWFAYCYADSCAQGFDMGQYAPAIFCIAANCTAGEGFRTKNTGVLLTHCTSDGNVDGAETEANDRLVALFSHFTNNSGSGTLDNASNDGHLITIGCNFDGNGIPQTGTTVINIAGMETDPGYADAVNDDYTPSARAVINQEFGSVWDDDNVTAGEGMNGQSTFIDIGAIQLVAGLDTSDYAENKILDYVLNDDPDWAPTTLYLALFASNPQDDQDYFGQELFDNGYARQTVTFGRSNNGVISNNADVLFPVASPSYWDSVTHFGIFDSLIDGNMIFSGSFVSSVFVTDGSQLRISAGNLTITLR